MPSFKSIATIAVVSALTYLGIEHYKQMRGK